MFRKHPLENPSLAPFGLAMPISQDRLKYTSDNEIWVNTEKLIARLWDKCNRTNAPRPLPVQTIVHEIMPGVARANRLTKGDFLFDGLPYLTRDITILSSVVQWFGTSCGRCFLEDPLVGCDPSHPEREFMEKFAKQQKLWDHMDMVAFFCHVCTPRCAADTRLYFLETPHYYSPSQVSVRDRAVVDGLMRWLGRKAGREFVARYIARREQALSNARERRLTAARKQQAA